MVLASTLLAFAGPPPEGVDPDAVDVWARRARAALEDPAGCWELTGTITSTIGVQARMTTFRRIDGSPRRRTGTFSGRVDDGSWTRFTYQLDPVEEGAAMSTDLHPFFATLPRGVVRDLGVSPSKPSDTANTHIAIGKGAEAFRTWRTLSGTAESRWDRDLDALVVDEYLQLPDDLGGETAHAVTVFPGGSPLPARLSVAYPRHVVHGSWPLRLHLYDAQSHVLFQEVEGVALPVAESVSGRLAVPGFTGVLEDRLDYTTAQRCL